MEKREELETLRKEQEELLKQERTRREGLEEHQLEQTRKLQEAAETLRQLEAQRREAEQSLSEASEKLQVAEKERVKLEHKVKLWKTPTVGLAKPIGPKVDKLTTHRGLGAFCEEDFLKPFHTQTSVDGTGSGGENETGKQLVKNEAEKQSDTVSDTPVESENVTLSDKNSHTESDAGLNVEQNKSNSESLKQTKQNENKTTDLNSMESVKKHDDLKQEIVENNADDQ
ncbi:switch-associated protein 70-like [Argopecten irradians]|uniref:switch-associated protein 70-like n=1 Tax=Argopecten irradians TaxID=31199 RepID=UPI00370FBB2F